METPSKPMAEWDRSEIGRIAGRLLGIPKEIKGLERQIGGIRAAKRGDKEQLDRMKNEIISNMRADPDHEYRHASNAKEREMIAKNELEIDQRYIGLEDQLNSRQAKLDQLSGELSCLEHERKALTGVLEAYHADVILQTAREKLLAEVALKVPPNVRARA
jgi:chromosome segregation ATPase